ncbi:MAG: YggS family pyridoxal phosphate-dependent enzyme [Dehalococcoidia bacterium]|nr:YggS family pyridoxal phosphate-dependent enzyme [Dehalococcoidia bacterium]MCK5653796.1 YggS family pyridoxal phosphate-dependent enzyme [Dehalococcoidia bacterium]
MDIARNLHDVERRIAQVAQRAGRSPAEITIVAVTKGLTAQAIEAALEAGIRHIGENRVQEAREKIARLSNLQPCATWHMVGHLQTNKVKTAVEIFDIIHSIDSLRLAEALSGRARNTVPVLLQVNISGEEPKSGFSEAELPKAVEDVARLSMLKVKGLMTIAPLVSDPEEVRPIFRRLRELRDSLGLEHLSMGMSDDFEVAVGEGATMVRIGRAIFGERG